MVAPVNLSQSPVSTANPNAVTVEMPRRQLSRRTVPAYSLVVAICSMILSRWSLRAPTCCTASFE